MLVWIRWRASAYAGSARLLYLDIDAVVEVAGCCLLVTKVTVDDDVFLIRQFIDIGRINKLLLVQGLLALRLYHVPLMP